MLYKSDFEMAKKRMTAFWKGEMLDRCVTAVVAPRNKAELVKINNMITDVQFNDTDKYWTNIDFILSAREKIFENTYYGGEAFPHLFVNLGPGITAAYFGSTPTFRPDTVWFQRIIEDWDTDLVYNDNSKWLKLTLDMTKAAVQAGKDKYLVSTTDLSGVADIMALLRGSEELCLDMMLCPDSVKSARDKILKVWIDIYDRLHEIIAPTNAGCPSRLAWAPGKHYPMQCDVSALISPKMFDEFFLPEVQMLCKYMDFPMYHLDGPDAIRHLDSLLKIHELRCIQWVPGSGHAPSVEWLPLLKRIQESGKSVLVYSKPDRLELETIFEALEPEKMYLYMSAQTPEDAQDALKLVEKLSFKKKLF